MAGQRARVDALQAWNIPAAEIVIERFFGAPITWLLAQLFDSKTAHVWLRAFLIGRVGPVISDQRVSHGHDLAAIRWIGQDFLVTGHRGVETDLADMGPDGAKRLALKNSAVFEREESGHVGGDC